MAKEYIEREAVEALAEDRLSSYHDKVVTELLLGNDFTANAAKQRFDTAREVFDLVKSIFPADVQEVRHGEWCHIGGDEWCCSYCGHIVSTEGSWEKPTKKYCSECGTKMDKE